MSWHTIKCGMAIGISRLSDVYLGHKHMNAILKKVYLKANSTSFATEILCLKGIVFGNW